MSQINRGVRALLEYPLVYNSFQLLMGASKVRAQFVSEYICPKPNDNILDVGCGTADILDFLPLDVNYIGFDASESYISFARRKFLGRGVFSCGIVDSVETKSLPKVDTVIAIGLIHHLDDDEVLTLMGVAKGVLKKGGRFIALDPCYEKGQSKVAKWLIDHDRGLNVRSEQEYRGLMSSVFSKCESSVVHRSWIPYTHHIAVCHK